MFNLYLTITKQHNNSILVLIVFSFLIIAAPDMTTTNGLMESFDIDGTLTLKCNFEGIPLPSLEWIHNGLPLSSSNDSITITTNRDQSYGTSMLQWVNASPDTVGTFMCEATNSLGSVNRSFIVQIRSKFVIF